MSSQQQRRGPAPSGEVTWLSRQRISTDFHDPTLRPLSEDEVPRDPAIAPRYALRDDSRDRPSTPMSWSPSDQITPADWADTDAKSASRRAEESASSRAQEEEAEKRARELTETSSQKQARKVAIESTLEKIRTMESEGKYLRGNRSDWDRYDVQFATRHCQNATTEADYIPSRAIRRKHLTRCELAERTIDTMDRTNLSYMAKHASEAESQAWRTMQQSFRSDIAAKRLLGWSEKDIRSLFKDDTDWRRQLQKEVYDILFDYSP